MGVHGLDRCDGPRLQLGNDGTSRLYVECDLTRTDQILLGVWGPVITSVGNLLTVVLVFLSDHFWGDGLESVTVWRIGGGLLISGGFCILALDVSKGS